MRMSFMPASPRNSAYSDHSQAASVPTEISVSIVAAPCLRFAHAALWNGHAAHSTTGVTRFSDSHCQLSNCSAGIIASSSAGTDSSAARIEPAAQRRGLVVLGRASRAGRVRRTGSVGLVAGGLDGGRRAARGRPCPGRTRPGPSRWRS